MKCHECREQIRGRYVKYLTSPLLYFHEDCWCKVADKARNWIEKHGGETEWLNRKSSEK